MSRLWRALESVNAPAVGAEWRKRVGDEFEVLRSAFLRADGDPATSHPCSAGCGCRHQAVHHDDGRIVAVCRCDPPDCDSFALTKADLIAFGIHWSRLGRAIANAFGCDFKLVEMEIHGVHQIATFSGMAVPVFLVIQTEPRSFRRALAELSARVRDSFVLLAPTAQWMDIRGHALLAPCKAAFFDLESNIDVLPSGALRSRRPGTELFSQVVHEQEPGVSAMAAQRVFALWKSLGSDKRKAPLHRVFSLLVLDGHTQEAVAKACDCSEGLVSTRVGEIKAKFQLTIQQLKAMSSHLAEMEPPDRDPRARRRYERGLTGDPDDG